MNYIDDWLVLDRSLLLSHVERLGLRISLAKSTLSPSQSVAFLGTVINSAQIQTWLVPEHSLTIQQLAVSFNLRVSLPLRVFQRMLGLMAATSSVIPLGLLKMRILQLWLKTRVFASR